MLDGFEQQHPQVRVVRLRPGLIFKREAAAGIRRLFGGPFLPTFLLRPPLIPVVPRNERFRFQALHSRDVGDAYRLAIVENARGAFNVAADPILDGPRLGELLDARPVPVAPRVLRAAAAATWRLRLQPSPPGWVDLAHAVPLMDTSRIRSELGWRPRLGADEALIDLMEGMRGGAGLPTPPLSPSTSGPLRLREILTGVGARAG
jgi:nucleoside-diphosphate-sugar epimerase